MFLSDDDKTELLKISRKTLLKYLTNFIEPQFKTQYENLLKEMTDYFYQRVYTARQSGIKDIIIDPGFGFAKTAQQNFPQTPRTVHGTAPGSAD